MIPDKKTALQELESKNGNRKSSGFSEDFVWGAATSAYQIEGAVKEGGKGEHIWDVYTKEPGKIYSGHTGEVACDHYHRYKEDVQLMKEIGQRLFRQIWTCVCRLQEPAENYERFSILV